MKQSGRNRWQLVANRTRSASIRLVSPSQVGSSVMVRTTAQVRVVALERGQLVDESGRFPVAVRVDQRHAVGKLFLGDVAEHAGKTLIPMPPAMNTWEHDGPNCGGTRPRRAGGGGRPDGAPDHAPVPRASTWSTRSCDSMDVWAASTLAAHKVERSSSPPRRSIGARFRAPAAGSRRARRRRRSPSARGSASRPRTCRRCRSRSRARSSRR